MNWHNEHDLRLRSNTLPIPTIARQQGGATMIHHCGKVVFKMDALSEMMQFAALRTASLYSLYCSTVRPIISNSFDPFVHSSFVFMTFTLLEFVVLNACGHCGNLFLGVIYLQRINATIIKLIISSPQRHPVGSPRLSGWKTAEDHVIGTMNK